MKLISLFSASFLLLLLVSESFAGDKKVINYAYGDTIPNPGSCFVVPSSIKIAANYGSYPKDDSYTAWYPSADFIVVGPLKSSTKIYVEYSVAGKPWFRTDYDFYDIEYNKAYSYSGEYIKVKDEVPQLTVGKVDFKIMASDALAGFKKELYSGSFIANKIHTGGTGDENKNRFTWYIDYDWIMPVAYVDFERDGLDFAPLHLFFHFKNPKDANKEYSAHLYYKGKEIGVAEGVIDWNVQVESFTTQKTISWSMVNFDFDNITACYPEYTADSRGEGNFFTLYQNPGEYEVKVLRNGELARTAKFTILPNGKLDNSINITNNIPGTWTIIPATMLGTEDGEFNANAWSTTMYWSNPLKGFTVAK